MFLFIYKNIAQTMHQMITLPDKYFDIKYLELTLSENKVVAL